MKTPGVAYLNARLGVFGGALPLCRQWVQKPLAVVGIHRSDAELTENPLCHRLIIVAVDAGADAPVILYKD